MMTCGKAMETIAADPSSVEASDHVAECASCRAFQQEMRALDARLGQALAIPVPPLRMPEVQALETQTVTVLPRRRMSAPAWVAIAASIAIAAVIGFRMQADRLLQPSLAEEIVAHLEHEPYAFNNTDKPVSDDRLLRIVPATIATLDHSAGLITYAQSCIIHGNVVPHLVIQGQHGPVTILLMPNEKVDKAQNISGKSINGVILPVGDGSIAIVGEDSEDLERIERQMKNSVTFST